MRHPDLRGPLGSWSPEPLLTAPDVAQDVGLADSVSMAMLRVLETLVRNPEKLPRVERETAVSR